MPGIAVDIETQLLIDKVVKGSKLDASFDDLLDDINKKAKRKGISPIDEKTFMDSVSVIEREFERINKKQIAGAGISGNSISDAIKQYERIEAAGEEIKKRFLKKNIELTESQSKALARRLIEYEDSVRQAVRKSRAVAEETDKKNLERVTSARQSAVQKGNWKSLGIDTIETGEKPLTKEIEPKEPKAEKSKGLLDDIFGSIFGGKGGMKGMSGGGAKPPGGVGAGAGGGAIGGPAGAAVGTAIVAAGILLAKAIESMVKESKILHMSIGFWNKSMGLLMDLILIPFMPLIAMVMVALVKAIMGFNNWWQTIWNTIKKEGLFGLIKLGLEWLWDTVTGLGKKILEFLFSDEPLEKKVRMGIDLILDALFLAFGWLIDLLFGKGAADKLKKIVSLSIDVVWGAISYVLSAIMDFVFGKGESDESKLKFINLVLKCTELLGEWRKVVAFLFGEDTAKWISVNLQAFLKDPVNWIWKFIEAIIDGKTNIAPIDFVVGQIHNMIQWVKNAAANGLRIAVDLVSNARQLLGFATGGIVPGLPGEPQLAVVHGGEEVIPVGGKKSGGNVTNQSSTTNNVFNFYGYQDDKFVTKVKEVIRQQGAQYRL